MALTVTDVHLKTGVYTARITGTDTPPAVALIHAGSDLPELDVTRAEPGIWTASCPLPAQLLTDGVQTLMLTDTADGTVLHSLALQAGKVLDGDLFAEIALLRDEVAILKAALRRLVRQQSG